MSEQTQPLPVSAPLDSLSRGISRTEPASRRSVASWVLYDLANTIFSMGVVTVGMSLWLRDRVGEERANSLYPTIVAVSMAIIFVLAPLVGAMSDRARRRMPFLIVSTVICVALTLMLGRLGYTWTIVAFIVANAAYQAGLQFYDSLIVEVTTEDNRGRIGGIGVGVGYIGSFIAIGIGWTVGRDDRTLAFTLVAIAFLAFAIPCFLFVRERGNPKPGKVFDPSIIARSARNTVATLRQGEKYPGLVRFLVGRVFYTDAINTTIAMMLLFATNVAARAGQNDGTAEQTSYAIMLSAISFSILGGFVWGRLVDRIGPKKTLDAVLYLWMATLALASAIGLLGLPLFALWIVAAMAGIGLGGIWSADRPLMLRLTPPDRIGEFYGLYGMVSRFSAVVGPALWALIAFVVVEQMKFHVLVGQGIAIAALLGLVVVGWTILRSLDDKRRNWSEL